MRTSSLRSSPNIILVLVILIAGLGADAKLGLSAVIRSDGNGRLLSVDYRDESVCSHRWNPMPRRHRELFGAVSSYVLGRTSEQVHAVLGKPQAKEHAVDVPGWWSALFVNTQEVWFYTLGPSGWGTHFVLCFANGKCTEAIELNFDKYCAYCDWKIDAIRKYAPGKSVCAMLSKFGEPTRRFGVKPGTDDRSEETWAYDILDTETIGIDFSAGECVAVNQRIILH